MGIECFIIGSAWTVLVFIFSYGKGFQAGRKEGISDCLVHIQENKR